MPKDKKVIFLDRDGVINKDPGGWTAHNYVTKWEEFVLLPNSIKALTRLNEAGYDIVVISNQAGVSKGCYSEEELKHINERMIEEVEKNGARLKRIYYCVHQTSDKCDCRKPRTGLFKKAEKELNINARGSFFIGDGKTDIQAGEKFGLKTVLVLSGKASLEEVRTWENKPEYIFDDLLEAVNFILDKEI